MIIMVNEPFYGQTIYNFIFIKKIKYISVLMFIYNPSYPP